MKKPLILLVDDDRAVLDALEVEMRGAFEEICRGKAFDRPDRVAEALPAWEGERRAVALAIVDQRMPGISGVEVLGRLRASPAAAHLRAVLLTGYAGLDSALAAKNEAGVDRYVEKPWDGPSLADASRQLLALHVRDTRADHHFALREITSEDEVRAHLRMRFEVFRREPNTCHLLPPEEAGIDVDAYDLVSRFFGLFAEGLSRGALVGTLRVTGQAPGPARDVVEAIAYEHPALRERIRAPRQVLPMLGYLIDREAVARLFETRTARGERVVEPGRLTLHPDLRAHGIGGRHLARHVVESATAFFFFLGFENAVLTCSPPHDLFYAPLGFRDAEGTSRRHHPQFGLSVICLHGTMDTVPEPARSRVLVITERIRRFGGTCLCKTYPACLPDAYATGEFHSTDLFCPVRARDLLPATADPSGQSSEDQPVALTDRRSGRSPKSSTDRATDASERASEPASQTDSQTDRQTDRQRHRRSDPTRRVEPGRVAA